MELAVSLIFTLIVTVLFVLILRPVALAVGLVDIPGGRKKHKKQMPVIGGLAMYFGLFFGGMVLSIASPINMLLLGASLLIIAGAVDDRFDLPPSVRLIAQTCAVLIMIYAAEIRLINIGSPLFFELNLLAFTVPFTILVTLTVINAFNVIDGIDGLAGGIAFIALGFMALIGIASDILSLIMLLMAVVTGFLVCNIPLRSNRQVACFMGDAGSTFLGFSVAWVGISLSQGESASMAPVTALWLVAVPIYDVVTSVLRRIFRGKSPFRADRKHFHHILMQQGLSAKASLLIILSLSFCTASIGFIGQLLLLPDTLMFLLWLVCGAIYYQDIVINRGARLLGLTRVVLQKFVSKIKLEQSMPTSSQDSRLN
jgi:UDP-GlcNAc:undecaprenyl-phosphate GlcNAc-1-phosphate transferase